MQSPATGEMVEVTQDIAEQATKQGICVLSVGEKITIKDTALKVYNFKKKQVTLEFTDDNPDRPFKLGERVNIKNGTFVIESYGVKFLRLKGLPAVHTISQKVVDEYRKAQINELRK